MKIGLSYSRCVRDIVDGKVDIDDVLIIVSRTNFDPRDDTQWSNIWQGYRSRSGLSNPEWTNYPDENEDKFRQISIELWQQGKFHEPRKFGAHPPRMPYYWLETFLPDNELEKNPAAKKAFDKFKMIAGLVSPATDRLNDNF